VARLKAIASPFRFDSLGYPSPAYEDRVLHDSIRTILLTTPGERVMRPTFGCWAKTILFASINQATASRAEFEIRRAVDVWEPRVELLGIDLLLDRKSRSITLHISWRASDREQRTTVSIGGLPSAN
jgi:uncharacterized protein